MMDYYERKSPEHHFSLTGVTTSLYIYTNNFVHEKKSHVYFPDGVVWQYDKAE